LTDAQSTTLTAALGGVSGTSASFTVNGTGTATAFTVANPGTQTAGTAFAVSLTAIDTYGNTVTGFTGSQSLSFSGPANSPNAHVPTYPTTATFAAGTASPSITLFDGQSTTLTVTHALVSGTSPSFTVNGTATAITYSVANPGPQSAGSAFSETVTAIDTYGNTATGYSGTKLLVFSGPANAPNGHVPAYPGSVTFSSGVGTASITLYDAQTTTLTATLSTVTGTSSSFTVSPAAASHFTVSNPGTQTAGTAFNVTVTALDPWNNTDTNTTGPQALAFSGPANSPNNTAPTYPGSVSFSSGVGTASITLTDAQSTTLTAALGGVSGTSASFTVNGTGTRAGISLASITTNPNPVLTCSGAMSSRTCSSTGEPNNSGNVLTAKIQLADAYGNAVTNTTGFSIAITLSVGATNGTVLPSSLTIANGSTTTSTAFTLTRSTGGGKTVTMTATATQTLTVTLSS
jgi:hypothetical protein